MLELVYNHDFVIREVAMPPHVHGVIVIDEDGRPNIYLNKDDPDERKLRAVKHEVLHGVRGDLFRGDADAAEEDARWWENRAALCIVDRGNR